MAVFDSASHIAEGYYYDKCQQGTWDINDLYEFDLNALDPIAIAQNLVCRMEKMMGIYPNVPELHHVITGRSEEPK